MLNDQWERFGRVKTYDHVEPWVDDAERAQGGGISVLMMKDELQEVADQRFFCSQSQMLSILSHSNTT